MVGHLHDQVADEVHLGESLEHRHEPPVLPTRHLDIDDIVVQVVVAGVGRDGQQLGARSVDEYRAQAPDF